VSEWVINNKLVLNTSQTKNIVFGSNHSLRPTPQLELCIKGGTIEQVEEAELLVVTLNCQLSWSNHIEKVVMKMGSRYVSKKKMFCIFDTKINCTSCSGFDLVPS
jgi:hypothetical protein